MSPPSFSTLLYRYFCFGWLFRDLDACQHDAFQRAAAERHNRRQAAWLPKYMLRWLVLGTLVYGVGGGLGRACDAPALAACGWAVAVVCASVAVAIAVAWLGLTRLHAPS